MTTVIVYGGSKEHIDAYADRLMAAFGCKEIRLGWSQEEPVTPGAIHFAAERPTFEPSQLVALYSFTGAVAYAEGHGFHA